MSNWKRRWISRREINDRKKWKQAWEENPEKMRKAQSDATKAAQRNKERRKAKLLEVFLSFEYKAGLDTFALEDHLANLIRSFRRRVTDKKIKALRLRLIRYGVLSYDHETGLWKVKVA